MAIETDVYESPGWWLNRLATELHERRAGRRGSKRYSRRGVESSRVRPGLCFIDDYLRGDPPLRDDIHSDWSAPFRQFLRMGRMNVAPLLISSTANRMTVRDFRTAAANDELGDIEARALMRRNNLRLKTREVHDDMLGLGDGYTIVTPPDSARAWSLITAESPMQCITAHDPATGATLAGLKMFRDDWDASDWAYLFLPGELYVARADVRSSTLFGRAPFVLSQQWVWDFDRFDTIPDGRVAMVRFRNKGGLSELEGYIDTLDRINDKLFNEWWIGKIQAFRQRALKLPDEADDDPEFDQALGDEMERQDNLLQTFDVTRPMPDDLKGMFTSSPDAMWTLPKGAEIWESGTVDVTNMVDSIKAELQWLASVKSLPMHSITPDAANGSAEGASLQREEHVYTIEDRIDRAHGGWAETMAMAFAFQGDKERSDVAQIDPLWGPTERYSLAEKTDSAQKLNAGSDQPALPWEAIATDVLQYAPGDVIDRLKPLRGADLLYAAPAPTPGHVGTRGA